MQPENHPPQQPINNENNDTAVGPEDYNFIFQSTPEQPPKEKKSFKSWFLGLTRAKQIGLVAGTCILLLIITAGILVAMSQPSNSTKQTVVGTADTNGDGVINSEDTTPIFGDTNGDGIVDQYDVSGDTESSTNTSLSWWQKVINAGKTTSSTQSDQTDTSSQSDSTSTAISDENSSSASDDGTIAYDDGEDTVPLDTAPDETEVNDPTDNTTDPSPTVLGGTSLTIASWNVLGIHNTGSHAKQGVQTIFSSAQVMGLQEVGTGGNTSVRNAIGNLASSSIGVYQPRGNTPILWNAKMYTKKASGYIVITGHGESKVATYVKLRNLASGQQFYVFNIHMAVGTADNSKEGCSSRICAAYQQEMKAFTKFIAKHKSENIPIFATGDYNANYRVDKSCSLSWYPCSSFRSLDFYSGYSYTGLAGISKTASSVGSSDRIIDYVFSWKRSNVLPVSMDIVAPNASCSKDSYGQTHCWNNSDHKPVLFTVNLTK